MSFPPFLFRRTSHTLLVASLLASVCGCEAPIDDDTESADDVSQDLKASRARRWKKGPKKPPVESPAPSPTLETLSGPATSLGRDGFSANGRVQPHGAPATYHFEYGPTDAYGAITLSKSLAPRLAAYYSESWDSGTGGWRGGSGESLLHVPTGGVSGGYVEYSEPTGDDFNHIDGIGTIHLVQWLYGGSFEVEWSPNAALGGGSPDMRDARIQVSARGRDWKPMGSELVFWMQSDVWHGNPPKNVEYQFTNWAHTGFRLTDSLRSGQWESLTYRLYNDTTDWTYAGTNRALARDLKRSLYVYEELDKALSNVDIDFFHVLTFIDAYNFPQGSIDFDNFEIAYRNHSLVFPSNGGTLASAPPSDEDPAALTDGWRTGEGRMWKSAPKPKAPLELVYDFENPVTLDRIQIHQHTEWPSRNVEVLASEDGTKFMRVAEGTLPQRVDAGAGFAFMLRKGLRETLDRPVRRIKVRVLDGYRAMHWGLGEIEVFGDGAVMKTDDDWYRVNADIRGLEPGQTVHYRLVAESEGQTVVGEDMTYTVPSDAKPEATTVGTASVTEGEAVLEGRMNTFGTVCQAWFEYGTDERYGRRTPKQRMGKEITPRPVRATITDTKPGSTVHFRLLTKGAAGTTYGEDQTFVAR